MVHATEAANLEFYSPVDGQGKPATESCSMMSRASWLHCVLHA